MSEVEETHNRIKIHKSVQGIIIVHNDGKVLRTTYGGDRREEGIKLAQQISLLTKKARSMIRDLDPTNDLTFLRIKAKAFELGGIVKQQADDKNEIQGTEIMVAPDKDFMLIVVQGPKGDKGEE